MPSWKGIGKRLREMFTGRPLDDEFYLELEDAMIEADMGVRTAQELARGAARNGARKGPRLAAGHHGGAALGPARDAPGGQDSSSSAGLSTSFSCWE